MTTTEAAEAHPSPAETERASDDAGEGADIGWLRAVGSGLVVLVVGFVGGLGGANLVLTKALGLTRDARQWIATGLFLVVVIVLAWALRWLQARRWI